MISKSSLLVFALLAGASIITADVQPTTTSAAKVTPHNHGYSAQGVIASINSKTKTFVVRSAAGKNTTLLVTGATKVTGGTLTTGRQVDVRWLAKDGKNIATSVKLLPLPKPVAAPVPAAASTPPPAAPHAGTAP